MPLDKKELKDYIVKISQELLDRARLDCVNQLSDNIIFVIKFIKPDMNLHPFKYSYLKKWWKRRSTDQLVNIIYKKQEKLSWIELVLLMSEPKKTFILVRLVHKFNDIETDDLKFHTSYPCPFNYDQIDDKFDLNKQRYL